MLAQDVAVLYRNQDKLHNVHPFADCVYNINLNYCKCNFSCVLNFTVGVPYETFSNILRSLLLKLNISLL